MKTRTPIIDQPAYRLWIDVTQSRGTTTVELVSEWPTANHPAELVKTRIHLTPQEIERLYQAIGEALCEIGPDGGKQ